MSPVAGDRGIRVLLAADEPEHRETTAIADWLTASPEFDPVALPLADVVDAVDAEPAAVVWIHGVRNVALEALGPHGPDLLLRGRLLLTGTAAILPSAAGVDPVAPNDSGRSAWVDDPSDDDLPALRGHASLRGHPLFAGLGVSTLTWAPAPGEWYSVLVHVRPTWPERGRVLAVERTAARIRAERATIWEYDGARGRVTCIGALLPLHGSDSALRRNAEALARNALRWVAAAPDAAAAAPVWTTTGGAAVEDRGLPMPELPLLEEPIGSVEFRLRHVLGMEEDEDFRVSGRRAFAAGGAGRGVEEVWIHPVRVAAGVRVRGARAEDGVRTPVGVERRLTTGREELLERVVVAREAPVVVVEWHSRTRTVEVEVGWTCDLRLAPPYPPDANGPLRWRRAGRGAVVAGVGEEQAAFVLGATPESFEVLDASNDDAPAIEFRARLRLLPRVPVRLAIVTGAGEAALRRALALADRTTTLVRARQGQAERLMTGRLALDAPDPAAIEALEWAKQDLDRRLAEAPGPGRSVLDGTSFPGAEGVRAALAALAAGDFRSAKDVLAFLGRHQDLSGRIPGSCSTSGVTRHDAPLDTSLYLLLAARLFAWTGDVPFLRGEWPRLLRAYEAARTEGGGGRGDVTGGAFAELAEVAESIGERVMAAEIRQEAERRRGRRWTAETTSSSPVLQVARGLVGAEPDASRGRLVLRPEPPPRWPRFTVSRLAQGDTELSLDYRRDGDVHTFRLRQERGAAPLQVVLEPALPGTELVSARVDDTPAELDARVRGDRLVAPLQVVLDYERVVVLEVRSGEEAKRRQR